MAIYNVQNWKQTAKIRNQRSGNRRQRRQHVLMQSEAFYDEISRECSTVMTFRGVTRGHRGGCTVRPQIPGTPN